MRLITVLMISGVAMACAKPASALDPALTFSFSDLVSDFDAGSLLFNAVDMVDTDGDVTRMDPLSDAFFDGAVFPGFFSLEMNVSPMVLEDPAQTLAGNGTLIITDADADTLIGSVNGIWLNSLGSANFVGNIEGLVITSDDNKFNGIDGSWASLEDLSGLFQGNVMTLAFESWFTDAGGTFQNFSDASTLAQGAIVPEPATLCLLAFGALAIRTRRGRSTRG